MGTEEIIKEVQALPVQERLLVLEQLVRAIRQDGLKEKIFQAVEELKEDYQSDKDLRAFTTIDFENFYEAR